MKNVTLILTALLLCGAMHAQFWYDPGEYKAGKIRVINHDDQVASEESSFPIHHIRYRRFVVDSVSAESSFGNHYENLAPHIAGDKEASYYLAQAIPFEIAQRSSICTAFGFGICWFFLASNEQIANAGLYIETGIVGCWLTSYLIKRYYVNKSIRTWNKHLDMGLVRP